MTGKEVDASQWERMLHNLYLVTLAIAFVATAVSYPVGVDWLVTGAASVALGSADIAVRNRLVVRGMAVSYFLAAGVLVGVLTAAFPMFATVGFGLLPLVFVRLPRWDALIVGVITTGSPYVIQPMLRTWLRGVGWELEATIRFGPSYFVVVGVALPVLTGLFTAGAVRALHRQSTQRQVLLDQLSATRAELASASMSAGRAEERQRLAHELHDTLAQGLAGVVLQLDAAEQYFDDNGDAARLVARARETARSYLVDTRRAVAALRPESLDNATVVDAVEQLCLRWAEVTGVQVDCVVRGPFRHFRPQVEVVALRVVQEALANASKHADAVEVSVTVECHVSELCLVVRDNGCGFDARTTSRSNGHASGGFGLATMRERVASVGGTLSVTSAPNAGTTITARLPDTTTTTGAHP